jgi:hypothetical protein
VKDKIKLLMDETGCERGEAELALEMCGFEVEEAVRRIPRLLRDICAIKGKFVLEAENRHGLFLVILNLKSRAVLRSRAILSYDPAVHAVSLDEDWFAFEKHLYGCRLWDGSLPNESLEVEQALGAAFRAADAALFERLRAPTHEEAAEAAAAPLRALFREPQLSVAAKKDILDLGQYRSLRQGPAPAARKPPRTPAPAEDLLVLKIELEDDAAGTPASELRAGDMVWARVTDKRDIAKYLARLFGGMTDGRPVPIEAPIEAIEAARGAVLARVRFSVGVCGDVELGPERRLRAARSGATRDAGDGTWWRRFFQG